MNKRLVLVTHGDLGKTILETAKKIIGDSSCSDCITIISNDGLSTNDLVGKITDSVSESDKYYIIATDFPGGSCFIASRKVSAAKNNISAVSGLNIAMVLSFVTKKELYDGKKLTEIMRTDGSRAIVT